MRVEIHVKSVEEIADVQASVAPTLQPEDELVLIVAQPVPPKAAERQERKAAS